MESRKANFTKRSSIKSRFIGDDNRGSKAPATKEFTEQAQGRCLVTLGLNENVKNLAFAIDSAPCFPEIETTISSRCHRV
jgi:hypothetical protein